MWGGEREDQIDRRQLWIASVAASRVSMPIQKRAPARLHPRQDHHVKRRIPRAGPKAQSRDAPPPSTHQKAEALARRGGPAIVEFHVEKRTTFDRRGGLARRWRTEANAIAVGWLCGSVSAFNNSRLRGIIPLWSQAGRALQGRQWLYAIDLDFGLSPAAAVSQLISARGNRRRRNVMAPSACHCLV